MTTIRQIRDTICEELLSSGNAVIKYNDHDNFSIEINPNPERLIIVDFNASNVEVYDGSPLTEAAETIYALELADPKFLEKLWQTLRQIGVKLAPNGSQ